MLIEFTASEISAAYAQIFAIFELPYIVSTENDQVPTLDLIKRIFLKSVPNDPWPVSQ
jgi:hypothetical protein